MKQILGVLISLYDKQTNIIKFDFTNIQKAVKAESLAFHIHIRRPEKSVDNNNLNELLL